ncbi:multidrug resistance efflux pump [Synechococcus sp. PCC 7502]|uniref:HlyD family efflux transporter periplasmic adaptor subunit n=1 Tax=Synechococcus sp. PCC 7502 TaxID=1173263 RepID=UPI00029FCF7B|nr:HlyD family efflux transporter periplasmic adaptor subunit [Synechococcus sp. PCC 7502]AFY73834.1 multidrug resistance efflux pump [Synechococcus sp. PCC 7502]
MTNHNDQELSAQTTKLESDGSLVPQGNNSHALVKKNAEAIAPFDQPLVLTQSPKWTQAIIWTLLGSVTFGLIWASVASIEESVPAQGKLEPQGAVKEVKAPASGVLKEILVKDGDRVKAGQVILRIDSTATKAQLDSLRKLQQNLQAENQFYRNVLNGFPISSPNLAVIPVDFLDLARNRNILISESQMYRMQVNGGGGSLTGDQQDRLNANQAELSSRSQAAEAVVNQSIQQLNQTQTKRLARQQSLALSQKILADIKEVAEAGGISKIQYLKQQDEVINTEAEIQQLTQEEMRLKAVIAEGRSRLTNTFDVNRKELTTQIADNTKRIAEIDSQLTKALIDNSKRLAEITGQISQAEVALQYEELRAPTSGTVFELKAGLGYVANTNTSETILKIVPDDQLIAKVYITNQDIGFVKENMPVDVRLDSFPFSEFGDVKGKLIWIGSDALPPDQSNPSYRFPAKIAIEKQSLNVNGREIRLQSGMSLSANIKIRNRTVISLFTDFFFKNTESLKYVR